MYLKGKYGVCFPDINDHVFKTIMFVAVEWQIIQNNEGHSGLLVKNNFLTD